MLNISLLLFALRKCFLNISPSCLRLFFPLRPIQALLAFITPSFSRSPPISSWYTFQHAHRQPDALLIALHKMFSPSSDLNVSNEKFPTHPLPSSPLEHMVLPSYVTPSSIPCSSFIPSPIISAMFSFSD